MGIPGIARPRSHLWSQDPLSLEFRLVELRGIEPLTS